MTIEELRETLVKLDHVARAQRDEYSTSHDPCWTLHNGESIAFQSALLLLDQYIAANKNHIPDTEKKVVGMDYYGGLANEGSQYIGSTVNVAFVVELKEQMAKLAERVEQIDQYDKDLDFINAQLIKRVEELEKKKVESLCGTCGGQGGYSKGMWIQPCESCIAAGRLGMVVKALSQAVVTLQQRINKWDVL